MLVLNVVNALFDLALSPIQYFLLLLELLQNGFCFRLAIVVWTAQLRRLLALGSRPVDRRHLHGLLGQSHLTAALRHGQYVLMRDGARLLLHLLLLLTELLMRQI